MTSVRERLSADMVHVLGHELRNPLASAVIGVSLAYEMTDDGDPRNSYLQQALDDLTRVSGLLTSYLELGRSGEPACTTLDLAGVAHRAAERYPLGKVVVAATDGVVQVRGDSAMLGRVLENLLDNAFAAGARRAYIRLSNRGDRCILDVTDDGPGVDPEIKERMFRPFVSGCGSSGLGLAIVREIVEAHRGAITLVPTERGATFRTVLPSPCS